MANGLRLGLALSGGGHRAACWAAGAVLGVVDAGEASDVVSVASVSGGSITNGVMAAGGDLRSAGRADVKGWLKPGLRQWAHTGLFFPGTSTDRGGRNLGLVAVAVAALVVAVAATIGASRDLSATTVLWVSIGLLVMLMLAVRVLAWRMLPAAVIRKAVLVGVATVLPLSVIAVTASSESAWWLATIWPLTVFLLIVVCDGSAGVSSTTSPRPHDAAS